MNEFEFDLSFRVRHPSIAWEKISANLGLSPKFFWTAGEQRKAPDGSFLEGYRSYTYCSFPVKMSSEMGLIDLIKLNNQKLKPNIKFLRFLHSSGGRLEYFIGWYSDGNSGEEFDAELLTELSDLKIGLAFDFYGGKK